MGVNLKGLVDDFNLKVINEGKDFKNKEITGFHISSGAYEFFGKSKKTSGSLVGYGSKEYKIFNSMTKEELEFGFANLAKAKVPAIIVTDTFDDVNLIKEYIVKNNITLLRAPLTKSELHAMIGTYISKRLSEVKTYHASLVNIYGLGVHIMGKSGAGKSEVTLDLINRGHFFIADDAIDTVKFSGQLWGKSSEVLKDNLEVRGIGILNIKKMYGVHRMLDETIIDLVIELDNNPDAIPDQERLGNKYSTIELNGIELPKIVLNTTTSKNLTQLIEAATINMKLKKDGYDASEEFIDRINSNLINKK